MSKPRRPRGPTPPRGQTSTWVPKVPESEGPESEAAGTETVGTELPEPDPFPAELVPVEMATSETAAPAEDPALPAEAPAEAVFESPAIVEPAPVLQAPAHDEAPSTAAAAATPDRAGETLPVFIAEVIPAAPFVPVPRIAFAPERIDMAGIHDVIAGYMRGETEAVAAHMRALAGARSPADMIRLQVGEMQRAADASLTCWSTLAHKASRVFAVH